MAINSINGMLAKNTELLSKSAETKGEDFKAALEDAVSNKDDKKLKESCDKMEAYMLGMMFKEMKKCMLTTDEDDKLIKDGDYVQTFENNFIDSMAEKLVEGGGIGLSKQLYESAKQTYAAQNAMKADISAGAAAADARTVEETRASEAPINVLDIDEMRATDEAE